MKIDNEALLRSSLGSGINLFLGAGFSLLASSKIGPLPLGDALNSELQSKFLPEPVPLQLPQTCQIIGRTQKAALHAYLTERFKVNEFNPAYSALEKINIKSIFTTNIDDLVFKIFNESGSAYLHDVALRGASYRSKIVIDYIPLHGCVAHPNPSYDFTPLQMASSFARDQDKWYGYVSRIRREPTLYWGYSVSDAGVLQALHPLDTSDQLADSWIVLHKDDAAAQQYYKALGFQIIVGSTKEVLDYFSSGNFVSPAVVDQPAIKNFPEYVIPNISQVPVRPLTEFYIGAEPTWYDIFSKNLYQTSHYRLVKNAALGKKHVMILGAPATGKSTLLKQLAISLPELGHPFFVDEITVEKARVLSRDISENGSRVCLFIDNVGDGYEAVVALKDNPLVKIVAAERDYYYESVSHRFPTSTFKVVDISGLDDADIQAIEERVPKELAPRPFKKKRSDLATAEQPTMFELISTTIITNTLVDRFLDVLADLKKTDPAIHDLLVVTCYMYTCRVPLSMDVAIAFTRSYGISYTEILEKLKRLGGVVSDYEGIHSDELQSYFVPRSRAVADAVMEKLSGQDLRRVLETFHKNVSPTKIARFDIFRRGAFDAKLVTKAFPKYLEGIAFYEALLEKDRSPYLKQQAAIYLSRRSQHELAFTFIDQAVRESGGKNPTIRNTYAVIQFTANINKPIDTTVISTLDESMRIIAECYNYDQRKTYHARVFADQAVKYFEKLPEGTSAQEYLELSKKWLEDELKQRPDDHRTKRELRRVQSFLHH